MDLLGPILGGNLLAGLIVAAVFSAALVLVPALRNPRYLWMGCVAAAAAYHWNAFGGFLLVNIVVYALLYALSRLADVAKRWRWACAALLLLAAVFTAGRVWHWDRPLLAPGEMRFIAYSLDMWLALRLITLVWEVGSGSVPLPRVSDFLVWTCLPFTLRGPVLRYSQMPVSIGISPALWRTAAWWQELSVGAIKLAAGLCLPLAHDRIFANLPRSHLFDAGTNIFIAGPLSFYLTSAGYFQLRQALGGPAGFKLPMSFNFAIGRENISAFWMNWNMTATFVFRDYLFYNRWGLASYNVYFNTLLLFTLVGLWHAANAYWILWGFLHGLLFCTFLVWRKYGVRVRHVPMRGTLLSRSGARALTYFAVCVCWYLPSKILQHLGAL